MKKISFAVAVLLLAGYAKGNGYYNGNNYNTYHNQVSQSLDDIHNTAQKIKEAKEEYRRYENEGDDYLENKIKERWEQRSYDVRYKGERLKQVWKDIFG